MDRGVHPRTRSPEKATSPVVVRVCSRSGCSGHRIRKIGLPMTPALIGKKLGMTCIFDEKGRNIPVTVVQATPNHITQVKTLETDGYNAVQLGFDDIKPKYSTMPLIGHTGKAGVGPKRHFREIRLKDKTDKTPGAA